MLKKASGFKKRVYFHILVQVFIIIKYLTSFFHVFSLLYLFNGTNNLANLTLNEILLILFNLIIYFGYRQITNKLNGIYEKITVDDIYHTVDENFIFSVSKIRSRHIWDLVIHEIVSKYTFFEDKSKAWDIVLKIVTNKFYYFLVKDSRIFNQNFLSIIFPFVPNKNEKLDNLFLIYESKNSIQRLVIAEFLVKSWKSISPIKDPWNIVRKMFNDSNREIQAKLLELAQYYDLLEEKQKHEFFNFFKSFLQHKNVKIREYANSLVGYFIPNVKETENFLKHPYYIEDKTGLGIPRSYGIAYNHLNNKDILKKYIYDIKDPKIKASFIGGLIHVFIDSSEKREIIKAIFSSNKNKNGYVIRAQLDFLIFNKRIILNEDIIINYFFEIFDWIFSLDLDYEIVDVYIKSIANYYPYIRNKDKIKEIIQKIEFKSKSKKNQIELFYLRSQIYLNELINSKDAEDFQSLFRKIIDELEPGFQILFLDTLSKYHPIKFFFPFYKILYEILYSGGGDSLILKFLEFYSQNSEKRRIIVELINDIRELEQEINLENRDIIEKTNYFSIVRKNCKSIINSINLIEFQNPFSKEILQTNLSIIQKKIEEKYERLKIESEKMYELFHTEEERNKLSPQIEEILAIISLENPNQREEHRELIQKFQSLYSSSANLSEKTTLILGLCEEINETKEKGKIIDDICKKFSDKENEIIYNEKTIEMTDVRIFLNQLEDIDNKYCMAIILKRIIEENFYYSFKQMSNILFERLKEIIKDSKRIYLIIPKEGDIIKSNQFWTYFQSKQLKHYYKDNLEIITKNMKKMVKEIENGKLPINAKIIFLDDVIGTGCQFLTQYNNAFKRQIGENEFEDILSEEQFKNYKFYFVSGIGTIQATKMITTVTYLSEDQIRYGRILTEKDRAFSINEINSIQKQQFLDFLKHLNHKMWCGFSKEGIKCPELLIVNEWNTPNDTIGCLWQELPEKNWKPLFPRAY